MGLHFTMAISLRTETAGTPERSGSPLCSDTLSIMYKYVIGIDEAGRGPLAGPVSVGVACIPIGFNWDVIPGVNDSKKLTEKNREVIFKRAQELKKEGKLDYAVCMVSAKDIDKNGIVPSIQKAMNQALQKIETSVYHSKTRRPGLRVVSKEQVVVKLDGGLRAPKEYVHQETIIKGDAKEKVIGLASIMAKVTRDRHMVSLSKDYPCSQYGFEVHKGYGTKKHRESIEKYGLSSIHRVTFCKNIKSVV
jgi:ribonuclease HII